MQKTYVYSSKSLKIVFPTFQMTKLTILKENICVPHNIKVNTYIGTSKIKIHIRCKWKFYPKKPLFTRLLTIKCCLNIFLLFRFLKSYWKIFSLSTKKLFFIHLGKHKTVYWGRKFFARVFFFLPFVTSRLSFPKFTYDIISDLKTG